MISRVADSLIWLSRYMERVEHSTRFIDVHLNISIEASEACEKQWGPLIQASSNQDQFNLEYSVYNQSNVLHFLVFSEENESSILSSLKKARSNANMVRDLISTDLYLQINRMYQFINGLKDRNFSNGLEDVFLIFDQLKDYSYQYKGIICEMGQGSLEQEFLNLGQYLERSDQVSRILDLKYYYLLPSNAYLANSINLTQWVSILRSLSSENLYRKEYTHLDPKLIAEFLIFHRSFPRSLAFSIEKLCDIINRLSKLSNSTRYKDAYFQTAQLRLEIECGDIETVFKEGIHEYLDMFQRKLQDISNTLESAVFSNELIPEDFPQVQ